MLRQGGGSGFDARSASGGTALYLAAEEGDERIVRRLLEHRADVALGASDGSTPVLQAWKFGPHGCAVARREATAALAPAGGAGRPLRGGRGVRRHRGEVGGAIVPAKRVQLAPEHADAAEAVALEHELRPVRVLVLSKISKISKINRISKIS